MDQQRFDVRTESTRWGAPGMAGIRVTAMPSLLQRHSGGIVDGDGPTAQAANPGASRTAADICV